MPDKTVTFAYPDTMHPLIVEAFARGYRRPEKVLQDDPDNPGQQIEVDNPESKEAHFTRKVIEYVMEVTKAYTPSPDAERAALEEKQKEVENVAKVVLASTRVTVE